MKKIIIFTASEIRHNYFRVYLSNDKNIKVLKTFSEKSTIIKIPTYRVVDIDTEEDWARAELIMEILQIEEKSS